MSDRLPPPDPVPLAPFAAVFDTAGFVFGSWSGGESRDGVVQMPYYQLSPEAERSSLPPMPRTGSAPILHGPTLPPDPTILRYEANPRGSPRPMPSGWRNC
ncbi:hypothetical protein ACVOMT_07755 [Sphingomonas panni]